jgi:hypothetical protein
VGEGLAEPMTSLIKLPDCFFVFARQERGLRPSVAILGLTPGGRPMWFYVQMWLPLLPIVYVVSCAVYVVSCAIDQQTNRHMWWHPEPRL